MQNNITEISNLKIQIQNLNEKYQNEVKAVQIIKEEL